MTKFVEIMTICVESMTSFIKQSDGTYVRTVLIHNKVYRLCVDETVWNMYNVSRHATYWIKRMSDGHTCTFKYGKVDIATSSADTRNVCTQCNKTYMSRSGFIRHMKKYHPAIDTSIEQTNARRESSIVPQTIHNTTNNNIQINLPSLRNFSDENPRWLTSDLIMRVIQHIPTAIPTLIQEKHFNDKFPENQNIRLENKRSIRKRLKVYDGGRWKIKERPEVEFRLVEQVYNVLDNFIDMVTEDADEEDEDDESSPLDTRIAHITRRIRASEIRSMRVRRMLGDWEKFKDSLQSDYEKTAEPFKDKIDTFLLDNELRLEQLRERRAMLMG